MAELFYRRLMSVADDYGRYHASPATLRGACWPTCPGKFSDDAVEQMLSECLAGDYPLIIRYEHGGAEYLQIDGFGQQTRTKSKFPDPSESKLLINCEADAKLVRAGAPTPNTKYEIRNTPPKFEPLPDEIRKQKVTEILARELAPENNPLTVEELDTAWERHAKYRGTQPRDVVFQLVVSANGKFDLARFRDRHPRFCAHWATKNWDYCPLSFWDWVEAGMPEPPPDAKQEKKRTPNYRAGELE